MLGVNRIYIYIYTHTNRTYIYIGGGTLAQTNHYINSSLHNTRTRTFILRVDNFLEDCGRAPQYLQNIQGQGIHERVMSLILVGWWLIDIFLYR